MKYINYVILFNTENIKKIAEREETSFNNELSSSGSKDADWSEPYMFLSNVETLIGYVNF